MDGTGLRRVTVIGCGPIGTSVALALVRSGVRVALDDRDPRAVAEARRMGAGTVLTPAVPSADLVVVATPPSTVADVLYEAQARGLGRAYTDVAGTKQRIWEEAELRGCDLSGYVPGHPVAAREPSGPSGARADLFAGRPWIVCPYPTVEPDALAAVDELVALCGGRRRDMTPAAHDRAVAALSHAPRLVSAVLAAGLADTDPALLPLAGAALRDTTRAAGDDPGPWSDVLAQNAEAVAGAVERLAGRLAQAARELRGPGPAGSGAVSDLLARGSGGRRALLEAAPEPAARRGVCSAPHAAAPSASCTPFRAGGRRARPRPGRPAGPVPRIRRFTC